MFGSSRVRVERTGSNVRLTNLLSVRLRLELEIPAIGKFAISRSSPWTRRGFRIGSSDDLRVNWIVGGDAVMARGRIKRIRDAIIIMTDTFLYSKSLARVSYWEE